MHTEPHLYKSVVGRHVKRIGNIVRRSKLVPSQVFRWNVRPGKRPGWRGEVVADARGVIRRVWLGVWVGTRRHVRDDGRVGVAVGNGHHRGVMIVGRGLRVIGGIVRRRPGVGIYDGNLVVTRLLGKFHVIGQLDIEAKVFHLDVGLRDGGAFRRRFLVFACGYHVLW